MEVGTYEKLAHAETSGSFLEVCDQGAERIVGFGEEKRFESRPAHRHRTEEEISEDRPRLVASWRRYRGTVAKDDRTAQKPDLYRHASIIEPPGASGKRQIDRSNG
jgi:hypothetical protein